MATHTATHIAATGKTVYAYPTGQSLADWATYRAALTEGTGDNVSRYTGTLNDANGYEWAIFEQAAQPTWDLAVATISIPTTGAGTGARSVTLTVDDGSSALQNATVRLTEGNNTFTATTNASGVATFSLDDATYTRTVTKGGYTYTPDTLVVNGTEAETISMSAVSPSASAAEFSTGYGYAYSEAGVVEAGAIIYAQLRTVPTGTGLVFDQKARTATSDANGYFEFTGMARGGVYNVWRGVSSNMVAVTVGDVASFEIGNFLGVDE